MWRFRSPHHSSGEKDGRAVVKRIALVISDVDGTLVTPDKDLTDASVRAVALLHERGIGFSIVSSRPPMGMRMLIAPLRLTLPIGAFSGGAVVTPAIEVIEQHLVPQAAATQSLELIERFGADIWAYTADNWILRNPDGDYVPREKRTIQADPTVVGDLTPYLDRVCKIVGSSRDFDRLAECERVTRDALGAGASVARSQPYYLDVTPPNVNKGTFLAALARRLQVEPEAIAVLGDMQNDLAMFCKAGLAIAMGNASNEVKQKAHHVTASNAEDGFAQAIERYILA
jgi:Cof subfamily protein (haloacid dehalogenase superfamily)